MTESETIHAEQLAELNTTLAATCMERRKAESVLKGLRDQQRALEQSIEQLLAEGPEDRPLFDKPGDPNGWMLLPLAKLELPAKVLKALTNANLKTIGGLTVAMDGNDWYRRVGGIGEEAAETIADAYEEFWRKHPEYTSPAAE